MMMYDTLYRDFIEKIPESEDYCSLKAKEHLIDDSTGIHVVFGMVIVPYILELAEAKNNYGLQKIFEFLEEMAESEDVKVREVLDFTILEQLADYGGDVLDDVKAFMKQKTLEHCEAIELYFNK